MENAARKAWNEANASGRNYNFLTGEEMPKAVARLGNYVPQDKVEKSWEPGVGNGSFKSVWASASQRQKDEWMGLVNGEGQRSPVEYLWKLWNSGGIDGVKHQDDIRTILDVYQRFN